MKLSKYLKVSIFEGHPNVVPFTLTDELFTKSPNIVIFVKVKLEFEHVSTNTLTSSE